MIRYRADVAWANCRNETITGAMSRLYIYGLAGIVAQGFAQLLDAGGERIVADYRVAPDRLEQFGFGHRLAGTRRGERSQRRLHRTPAGFRWPVLRAGECCRSEKGDRSAERRQMPH